MMLKKGLQEFGLRREEDVSIELMQIHMQDTFAPKHFVDLTSMQRRRKALESLICFEKMKTGKIKGCMCTDDSKQRPNFEKGEATSPTVITDSVIIASAVDAHKGQDVAVINLPDAFLHAKMDYVMHMVMVIQGKLAELVAETAP